MQSQHEDFFECSSGCVWYGVLDVCWVGVYKILEVRQHTVERMGEERQGNLHTPCTTGWEGLETGIAHEHCRGLGQKTEGCG